MGRALRGERFALRDESGHTPQARLELQKKTLAATERDEQKRGIFRQRLRGVDPERLLFVDESSTNIAMVPRYGRAPKGERAHGKAPRNWGKNVTLISSITPEGMGACVSIEGSSDTESFGLYMRDVLAPRLRPAQNRAYGQPLGAQEERVGQGPHRAEGMPVVATSLLLTGHEPHRGGLFQGKEPHKEGESEDARSTLRGHRRSARSGQPRGRSRLLRGLRLQEAPGPLFMKTALDLCCAILAPARAPTAAR